MTYRPNHPDFIATATTKSGVVIIAKAWGKGSTSIRRVEIAGELYESGEYNRAATQADATYDAATAKKYLDSLTRPLSVRQ